MVKGIFKTLRACALMVSLLAGSTTAFAQYVDWIGYGPGGEGRSQSSSAEGRRTASFDSEGNTYVAGWVQNQSYQNPLLVKYAPDGALLWQRRISVAEATYGRGVGVDAAGNSILFAYANNYPETAFRVIKHSPSGEQLWSLRLADQSGHLYLSDLVVNPAGDFYLLGGIGENENRRAFVRRYGADGVILWETVLTGSGDASLVLDGSALEVDSAGNPNVCTTIRPQQYVGAGFSIFQLLSSGAIGWQRSVDGALSCSGFGIDAGQNLVVASQSSEGLAVFQFDQSGNQRWASTVASRFESPDLALDGSGDIAIVSRGSMTSPQLARIAGATGQLKWIRTVAASSLRQRVNVDAAGNAVVVSHGYSGPPGARSAVSMTKFDPSGAVLWSSELTAATTPSDRFWTSSTNPFGGVLVLGDDRTWPYQLLARQYGTDGSHQWTGRTLPQSGFPQRAGLAEPNRFKSSLVHAGEGYFANSVVWNGDGWDCHVDRFSREGGLLWGRTEAAVAGDVCENIEIGAGPDNEHYIARFLPTSCPITTNTREQFVLNRHDGSGQPLWQRVVWSCPDPDRPSDARIVVAANGLVYVVGRRGQTTQIVSYDPEGNERWRNSFGLIMPEPLDIPVRFDAGGNLLLAGWTFGGIGVSKISPQGLLVWQFEKTFSDGGSRSPADVEVGENGDIAVILQRSEYLGGPYSQQVVVTMLLSEFGTEKWSQSWSSPDPGQDEAKGVAIDVNGDVVVMATSHALSFPNTPREPSAVVVRYSRDGVKQWQRFVREGVWSSSQLLKLDGDGNSWLVMADDRGGDDEHFVVTKLSRDGRAQWTYRHDGGLGGEDYAGSAVLSSDGALIIAASTNAHSSSDRLGLIRLSDLPRAERILANGFDRVVAPVGAQDSAAPAR